MARSINTIYNSMVVYKNNQDILNGLTSTSNVAIWKLIFYVCSIAINVFEQFQDLFKADVQDIIDKNVPATARYWNNQMLNVFQYDPTDSSAGVIYIDDTLIPRYRTVDPSKRIIKYCSTNQVTGTRNVSIKVAKSDGSNGAMQLLSDELLSSLSFVNDIQPMGLIINVTSFPPDKIKFIIDFYIDGQFGQATVANNIENTIKNYLRDLSNISFDGVISNTDLIIALKNTQGIKDVYIKATYAKSDGGLYAPYVRVYDTKAGYAVLDTVESVFTYTIQK